VISYESAIVVLRDALAEGPQSPDLLMRNLVAVPRDALGVVLCGLREER